MKFEHLKKTISLKRSEDYFIQRVLAETPLSEIMTAPAVSVHVDEPFHRVADILKTHGIRHLPVVDHDHKLVGIISQRDLFRICPPRRLEDGSWKYAREELDNFILRHVMIPLPFCMRAEECVGEAVLRMLEEKVGSIPVVNGEHVLKGIVTQYDILEIAAAIYLEGS